MSEFFPDVNSKQMVKVLERLEFVRQTAESHAIYRREADVRFYLPCFFCLP